MSEKTTMKNVFGIGNHSLFQINEMLKKHYDVDILTFKNRVETPTDKRIVLLCPTVALYKANLKVLEKCKKASIIVFDSPVKLEYLKPVPILDVADKKTSYVYKFKELSSRALRSQLEKDMKEPPKGKVVQIIPNLLKQTHGSFISSIQDFLYRIPNLEKRHEIQTQIFTFLSEGKTRELASFLEKEYGSKKLLKEFIEMLKAGKADDFAKGLKEVTASIRGKKALRAEDAEAKLKATNYKKISKEHNLSMFDLRYSAKVVARILIKDQK